jgi:hypothetical protein
MPIKSELRPRRARAPRRPAERVGAENVLAVGTPELRAEDCDGLDRDLSGIRIRDGPAGGDDVDLLAVHSDRVGEMRVVGTGAGDVLRVPGCPDARDDDEQEDDERAERHVVPTETAPGENHGLFPSIGPCSRSASSAAVSRVKSVACWVIDGVRGRLGGALEPHSLLLGLVNYFLQAEV